MSSEEELIIEDVKDEVVMFVKKKINKRKHVIYSCFMLCAVLFCFRTL